VRKVKGDSTAFGLSTREMALGKMVERVWGGSSVLVTLAVDV